MTFNYHQDANRQSDERCTSHQHRGTNQPVAPYRLADQKVVTRSSD